MYSIVIPNEKSYDIFIKDVHLYTNNVIKKNSFEIKRIPSKYITNDKYDLLVEDLDRESALKTISNFLLEKLCDFLYYVDYEGNVKKECFSTDGYQFKRIKVVSDLYLSRILKKDYIGKFEHVKISSSYNQDVTIEDIFQFSHRYYFDVLENAVSFKELYLKYRIIIIDNKIESLYKEISRLEKLK